MPSTVRARRTTWCTETGGKWSEEMMGPSHDEVAINRTSIERDRDDVIAANRRPLDWLNFFLADVKDGLGPFLAIFLMSSQRWDAGRIGVVLTIAGGAKGVRRGAGRRPGRRRSLEADIDRDQRPGGGHRGRRDGPRAAILAHCG